MPGKVKVAAGHSPEWQRIDYRLDVEGALPLVEENIAEIASIIDEAANAGCVMVAFPEDTLGITGWLAHHFDDQRPLLIPAVERMLAAVGKKTAQRSIYTILCNDVSYGDDIMNTAILFGRDGAEIGRYHKVNLPIAEQSRKPGDSFPVFETPELGGIGMCICYDLVFPETARALALGGADVVFHLTMGGAACPDGAASDAAFIARAADNELYLVVSWRADSRIYAPSGEMIARAKQGERITVAEFDPFSGREFGDSCGGTFPDHRARLFRERMPAAYSILTDPNPPALAKFAHMPIPSGDEASRLGAEVLTTGADRFSAAEKLAKAGKRDEAIAEFEAMSAHFKTTWIGRASRARLKELRG